MRIREKIIFSLFFKKNIKNTEIIYTRVKNVKKSDIIGSVYAVKTNIRRV